MDIISLDQDINVFCITAESFPNGIMAAHKKLHSIIPFSTSRRYFGLSRPENEGDIVYKAAAEELEEDKGKDFVAETFTIKKGKYMCITVLNFKEDSQSIGKAFQELITQPDIDPNGYCVEWYINNKDVKCMVRINDVE